MLEWKKLQASNGDSYKGYVGGLNICDIINVQKGYYLLSFYEGGLLDFTTLEESKSKAEELFSEWIGKAGLAKINCRFLGGDGTCFIIKKKATCQFGCVPCEIKQSGEDICPKCNKQIDLDLPHDFDRALNKPVHRECN